MEVNQRIKDVREDADKTQKEIADLLEITQQTYSRYERGINEIPIRHIIKLAKYYGISTDYLLGVTNGEQPQNRAKCS